MTPPFTLRTKDINFLLLIFILESKDHSLGIFEVEYLYGIAYAKTLSFLPKSPNPNTFHAVVRLIRAPGGRKKVNSRREGVKGFLWFEELV